MAKIINCRIKAKTKNPQNWPVINKPPTPTHKLIKEVIRIERLTIKNSGFLNIKTT
jgi:hypothetical protein